MAVKEDLKRLVSKCAEQENWDKLEALYMLALKVRKDNLILHQDCIKPYEEAKEELEALGVVKFTIEEEPLWESIGEDTKESLREMFLGQCKESFPESFTEEVKKCISSLSLKAKRMAFLLYRDGTLPKEELRPDRSLAGFLEPAYKVIFGGSLREEERGSRQKGGEELIMAGLLYHDVHYGRRNVYYRYIAPCFSKDIWLSLPKYITFNEIKPLEKELLSSSLPRQEEPSPPLKTAIRGLEFTDEGLEELVLNYLHKLSGIKEKAHVPREELRGIHFDAWVKVGDKYIVAECKGSEVSPLDVRDFNSRVEKLRRETKEEVEPWIVTSFGFKPGGSEEAQYWKMKMNGRRELLKRLLAKGLIRVDLEKGEPILSRDKGVYVEIDENLIKES